MDGRPVFGLRNKMNPEGRVSPTRTRLGMVGRADFRLAAVLSNRQCGSREQSSQANSCFKHGVCRPPAGEKIRCKTSRREQRATTRMILSEWGNVIWGKICRPAAIRPSRFGAADSARTVLVPARSGFPFPKPGPAPGWEHRGRMAVPAP